MKARKLAQALDLLGKGKGKTQLGAEGKAYKATLTWLCRVGTMSCLLNLLQLFLEKLACT